MVIYTHTFVKPIDHVRLDKILGEIASATNSKEVQLNLDITRTFYPQTNSRNAYFSKPGGVFRSKDLDSLEFTLECDMDSGEDGSLPDFSKIIFRPSETNTDAETAYANQIIALLPKAEKISYSSGSDPIIPGPFER